MDNNASNLNQVVLDWYYAAAEASSGAYNAACDKAEADFQAAVKAADEVSQAKLKALRDAYLPAIAPALAVRDAGFKVAQELFESAMSTARHNYMGALKILREQHNAALGELVPECGSSPDAACEAAKLSFRKAAEPIEDAYRSGIKAATLTRDLINNAVGHAYIASTTGAHDAWKAQREETESERLEAVKAAGESREQAINAAEAKHLAATQARASIWDAYTALSNAAVRELKALAQQ